MASLYDLELQESNNFIRAIIGGGVTPALKLMREQLEMAKTMGDAGKDLLKMFEDGGEMAAGIKRMESLSQDVSGAMTQVDLKPELAVQANSIFSKNPNSMTDLSEDDQKTVKDYWLKKKTIIVLLLRKGYTHEELFS